MSVKENKGVQRVVKYLSRFGPRPLRLPFQNLVRVSSNEPCPPAETAKPSPSKGSESTPAERPPPPPPQPPPPAASPCPPPPPCPSMPTCPPAICPDMPDPNDPCNYCPPPCIDPEYPDLTKLKKLQCLFQQDDDLPVFLKKGNSDAFVYQVTILLILLSLGVAFVSLFKSAQK